MSDWIPPTFLAICQMRKLQFYTTILISDETIRDDQNLKSAGENSGLSDDDSKIKRRSTLHHQRFGIFCHMIDNFWLANQVPCQNDATLPSMICIILDEQPTRVQKTHLTVCHHGAYRQVCSGGQSIDNFLLLANVLELS